MGPFSDFQRHGKLYPRVVLHFTFRLICTKTKTGSLHVHKGQKINVTATKENMDPVFNNLVFYSQGFEVFLYEWLLSHSRSETPLIWGCRRKLLNFDQFSLDTTGFHLFFLLFSSHSIKWIAALITRFQILYLLAIKTHHTWKSDNIIYGQFDHYVFFFFSWPCEGPSIPKMGFLCHRVYLVEIRPPGSKKLYILSIFFFFKIPEIPSNSSYDSTCYIFSGTRGRYISQFYRSLSLYCYCDIEF